MSDGVAMIPLSEPSLGGNVRKYLDECLATNFVSSVGPFVDRFERAFAAYVGSRYAVACASGTAAIHVALRLAGVEDGDEVMVPDLTFIASANPILYERARPTLVDSEAETWNMDPALVVLELERRARAGAPLPKAIEVVHLLGHPASIEPIVDACDRFGIVLIEDAAESLGARYTAGRFAGRHVGTIGRLGCFSFNGNKVITCGGGGMIVTDDEALARRARHLTTQARLPGSEYQHDEIGYNYRLTNVAAAIGLAQLEQLEEFLNKKRAIAAHYDEGFLGKFGISLPPRASWAHPSFWLYSIRVDAATAGQDRKALHQSLLRSGIQTRPIWTPLHTFKMFKNAPRLGGVISDRLHATALSLPCSSSLVVSDQARVIATLREALEVR